MLRLVIRAVTLCIAECVLCVSLASASDYTGEVVFNDLPVPGATVQLVQSGNAFSTMTSPQGLFVFFGISDAACTLRVSMTGFTRVQRSFRACIGKQVKIELSLLSLTDIIRSPAAHADDEDPSMSTSATMSHPAKTQGPLTSIAEDIPDSLVINGSVSNGASSPFGLPSTIGNNRHHNQGLYNGSVALATDNSGLDAAPFALGGTHYDPESYNRWLGSINLGGPLKIPLVNENGTFFFLGYDWKRWQDMSLKSTLVPTTEERQGDFSKATNELGQLVQIFDPTSGMAFPNNTIPENRISPQATALLALYPQPNLQGNKQYNYEASLSTLQSRDAIHSYVGLAIGHRDELSAELAGESSRSRSNNLFKFIDQTSSISVAPYVSWSHRTDRSSLQIAYRFDDSHIAMKPYWQNRSNISGRAGITGNDQNAVNWGPPTVLFSGGTEALADGNGFSGRNKVDVWSSALSRTRGAHNIKFGGELRLERSNYNYAQDPRGMIVFTGNATRGQGGVAVTGSDVADFVLGLPESGSLSTDKWPQSFSQVRYNIYFSDDWRVSPEFTVTAGLRWDYVPPLTEKSGHLVNLEVAPGFGVIAPVEGTHPTGNLTSIDYPPSLLYSDRKIIEPRVGAAWRPIPGSSLLVRGGFGVYSDASVYELLALLMGQQPPFATNVNLHATPDCILMLSSPFAGCPRTSTDVTFGIDPHFSPSSVKSWQASVQRDLPLSLQLAAAYLGTRGSHMPQEFFPNTYPLGGENPCPTCPVGFTYAVAHGISSRNAGQLQLRRRLSKGFVGLVQYTFSKSTDNESDLQPFGNAGGNSLALAAGALAQTSLGWTSGAQNWKNLNAERSLSKMDQRHVFALQLRYTTDFGAQTSSQRWLSILLKEWTLAPLLRVASGMHESPLYFAALPTTTIIGALRPDYTGLPVFSPNSGRFLNPNAYTAPHAGQWGDAPRNSITGPSQATCDVSLARTLRIRDRIDTELRIDSFNALNHVTFVSWNTVANSTTFGFPTAANAMRSIQLHLRLSF